MATPYSPTPAFWAATASDGGGTVVSLYGEIDIAGACELERRFTAALMRTSTGRLLVDLSAVEFMDSSGLHALLRLRSRCEERGVALAVRRGPRAVHRVFEVTGTASKFRFVD